MTSLTAVENGRELTRGEREASDPELEGLVREIIGRVADKWTMLALETLEEHGRLRFTRLGELVGGVSQKMLTKTLRQMEADGLVLRTVYPVVPPRVEYALSSLGATMAPPLRALGSWSLSHGKRVEEARERFDARAAARVRAA